MSTTSDLMALAVGPKDIPFQGGAPALKVGSMGSTIDLVKELKVSPEVLRVLTRLVGLINTPTDAWTEEEHRFFKEVRALVQQERNGDEER